MDYKEEIRKILNEDTTILPEQREKLKEVLINAEKIEDEGIRKALIKGFNECLVSSSHYPKNAIKYWHGIVIEDILTWLEKQGQKDPCKDCEYPTLNCHNFPCLKKQKYQGKSALEAVKEEKVDNSNKVEPRFKESDWITNGENTIQITMVDTKSGHSGYYRCFEGSHGFGWYVIDIESANKNYHLWTVTDTKDGDVLAGFYGTFIFMGKSDGYCGVLRDNTFIRSTGNNEWTEGLHPATKEQRELLFSKMKEAGYEWDSEKKELRKIEQKLAKKVEPRFKVDDFIVNNNSKDVYQVTEIRDDEYCLWPLYAEIKGYLRINDVDNEYHLWSIKDAKDGDVLVYNNIATEIIMLFRYKAINKPMAYTHFHIFDNDFRVYGCCDCGNGVHPATKKQRDHLFQKIEEAGYKWDSDIKKLKKIETVDIPFNAKESELIEATYFIPEGFHAEIVDNKVIIKKGKQKSTDTDNKFIRMRETKPKDISEFLDRLTTVEQEFLWEHIAKIRDLDKEEQKSSWSKEYKRIISAVSQLLKDCESENGWNCVYSNDREVFFVDIEKWLQSIKERVI